MIQTTGSKNGIKNVAADGRDWPQMAARDVAPVRASHHFSGENMEMLNGTHNAGVAGSSPAPATSYAVSVAKEVSKDAETALRTSPTPVVGWVEWCAFTLDAAGTVVVGRTIYAETIADAEAHFGKRGRSVQVASRLALREISRLPAPATDGDRHRLSTRLSFKGWRGPAVPEVRRAR